MEVIFQIKGFGKTIKSKLHLNTVSLQIESLECLANLMKGVLLKTEIDADVNEDCRASLAVGLKAQLQELEKMKRVVLKRQRSHPSKPGHLLPIADSSLDAVDLSRHRLDDALDPVGISQVLDDENNFLSLIFGQGNHHERPSRGVRHPVSGQPELHPRIQALDECKSTKKWNVSSLRSFFWLQSTQVAPESSATGDPTKCASSPPRKLSQSARRLGR